MCFLLLECWNLEIGGIGMLILKLVNSSSQDLRVMYNNEVYYNIIFDRREVFCSGYV